MKYLHEGTTKNLKYELAQVFCFGDIKHGIPNKLKISLVAYILKKIQCFGGHFWTSPYISKWIQTNGLHK